MLAVVNLCQAYQRTNKDRERSLRRALAFLTKYSSQREDKAEVHYNLGRALHYLGLNSQAMELYQKVIEGEPSDLKTRAVYNLSLILKGSGVSTGALLNEGVPLERLKKSPVEMAHELLLSNIVI